MIDPAWTPPASRRFDPEEAVLCTYPRYYRAMAEAEEREKEKKKKEMLSKTFPRKKRKQKQSQQKPSKDACSEKSKAATDIHGMDALEIMMERVARRVYRECRKEDLMRETAYLLDMKG